MLEPGKSADDPASPTTISLMVRVLGNRIEMLDGTPVPGLKAGATGHLVLPSTALVAERGPGAGRAAVTILAAGTELLAQVNPSGRLPAAITKHLRALSAAEVEGPGGSYVSLFLDEPVRLQPQKGKKRLILSKPPCRLPSLERNADSVNHAYSEISTAYETQRISHTGNVFQRVFFRDADGRWKPIELLRERVESGLTPLADTVPPAVSDAAGQPRLSGI